MFDVAGVGLRAQFTYATCEGMNLKTATHSATHPATRHEYKIRKLKIFSDARLLREESSVRHFHDRDIDVDVFDRLAILLPRVVGQCRVTVDNAMKTARKPLSIRRRPEVPSAPRRAGGVRLGPDEGTGQVL
jgi:hypothetical protein